MFFIQCSLTNTHVKRCLDSTLQYHVVTKLLTGKVYLPLCFKQHDAAIKIRYGLRQVDWHASYLTNHCAFVSHAMSY